MSRSTIRCFILVSTSLLCAAAQAGAGATNSCIDCHQDPDFYAEYPKLHAYFQQWLSSPHRHAGVQCQDCHGGNPKADSRKKAHDGVLPMNDRKGTLHFQQQPETCGQCHRAMRRAFVDSKHYAALMDQRAAPTCTTCHRAMSRRPELRDIVLNACRNCHGPGNSENLPAITAQAETVFNRLNIAAGLLGWTRIHFESQGWPDDSSDQVAALDKRYQDVVNRVHRFDLEQTGTESATILAELRDIFEQVRRAHEQARASGRTD